MTRITQKKELEQFELHKFDYKKTPEDKAYETFINSIYDEDGKLHVVGKDDVIDPEHPEKSKITPIPEIVVEVCRVNNPEDGKEYLVYDVNQWGYLEDGTQFGYVHLQDIGVWKEYTWIQRTLPMPVFKGEPQRKRFKDFPESSKNRYDILFNHENIEKIKKKCNNVTRLYVYDLGRSGKGGRDGKIGVANWKDFEERSFQELIEGTYLERSKLEQRIKAMEQKEQYLALKEQMLDQQERDRELKSNTTNTNTNVTTTKK